MLEEDAVAPHSMEPQLRKLGLVSSLVRGVPTLKAPHTICKAGDTLDANQAHLLKLFNRPMATVRVICLVSFLA
jgi:mRNA turnover protein 4